MAKTSQNVARHSAGEAAGAGALDLQRRMEQLIQQKVKDGLIRPKIGVHLLDQYSKAFHEYTYLGPREPVGGDEPGK